MTLRRFGLVVALGAALGLASACGQQPQRVFAVQVAEAPAAGAAAALPAGAGPALRRATPTGLDFKARNRAWDLNAVSVTELEQLPGMDAKTAAAIVAGRPYKAKRELLKRHILSAAQYARWKDYLVVHRARAAASPAAP